MTHDIIRPHSWRKALPHVRISQKNIVYGQTLKSLAKVMQVMPFVLCGTLKESDFTKEARDGEMLAEGWQQKVEEIEYAFVTVARSNKLVFADMRWQDPYAEPKVRDIAIQELDDAIKAGRAAVVQAFAPLMSRRPNLHTGLHIAEAMRQFGVMPNVDADFFEIFHKTMRLRVSTTSGRNIEPELLHMENVRHSMASIVSGAAQFKKLPKDKHLYSRLQGSKTIDDLLNVPLPVGGLYGSEWDEPKVPPPHTHTHTHTYSIRTITHKLSWTHTHTHTHICTRARAHTHTHT
jgi:hypothetical protein